MYQYNFLRREYCTSTLRAVLIHQLNTIMSDSHALISEAVDVRRDPRSERGSRVWTWQELRRPARQLLATRQLTDPPRQPRVVRDGVLGQPVGEALKARWDGLARQPERGHPPVVGRRRLRAQLRLAIGDKVIGIPPFSGGE